MKDKMKWMAVGAACLIIPGIRYFAIMIIMLSFSLISLGIVFIVILNVFGFEIRRTKDNKTVFSVIFG